MAEVTGYYGGYLNALSTISGVEEANNRIALRNQQMQLAAKQDQLNDQTRATLAQAFRQQQQNSTVLDKFGLEDSTAEQYRAAGKAAMATDPATGINLLREGDSLKNQTSSRRIEAARVEMIKQDRLASLAGMVSDQTGLDEYVAGKAALGEVIPQQYRTWGPETEAWLERQNALGVPASKAANLALRTRKMELDEAERSRKAEIELEKRALSEAKEARLQAGHSTRSLAQATPRGEMAEANEVATLTSLDPDGLFKKMDLGGQREAAKDVYLRAKQAIIKNPKLDPEEALNEARKGVLAEITPGEYMWNKPTRVRGKASTSESSRPATMEVDGEIWQRQPNGKYRKAGN